MGNFFNDLANVAVQGSTFGLAGVDNNGHLTSGAVTNLGLAVVDRVTGRDIAVQQQKQAEAQFAEEKRIRQEARVNQENQNQIADLSASNAATPGGGLARGVRGAAYSDFGNSQDLLGL